MRTATATIIVLAAAISGCATPPPQVRTVYVPEPQSARIERNKECTKAMYNALAMAKFTLEGIKECEKAPADGCIKMRVAHRVNKEHGFTDAARRCMDEMNIGSTGMETVNEYGAISDEIVRRLDRLEKRALSAGS